MGDSPYAVHDSTVGRDPEKDVRKDDVVEVTLFLVLEEEIRHPQLGRVRQGQVLDLP